MLYDENSQIFKKWTILEKVEHAQLAKTYGRLIHSNNKKSIINPT